LHTADLEEYHDVTMNACAMATIITVFVVVPPGQVGPSLKNPLLNLLETVQRLT
jgi:hypothetical protein